MPYVRGDLILLDTEEEFKKSKDAINTLLTRDPLNVSVPMKDAEGKLTGCQGVWLPGSLLVELLDTGIWPVVQMDQSSKTQVYFSREETTKTFFGLSMCTITFS